jgi:methyl-accepting chemotaxis protein
MIGAIRQISDLITEITSASREQSIGIEQVNTAVTQLDEVTQQNAALVEEAAAAAMSLVDQAEQLNEKVSHYKLNHSGNTAGQQNQFTLQNTQKRRA